MNDPAHLVAIKMIKNEYLKRTDTASSNIQQEIKMMQLVSHKNAVQFIDCGANGTISKPNGSILASINYIVMEYVQGGLLFDIC